MNYYDDILGKQDRAKMQNYRLDPVKIKKISWNIANPQIHITLLRWANDLFSS